MMTLPDLTISSDLFWWSALVTALIDLGLVFFLARSIPVARFRRFHWSVTLASVVFWVSFGLSLFALTWESYYARFLPDPARRSLSRSLLDLLPYPFIGLLMWWLSLRLRGNPVVNFCLLGGLHSILEHVWGIYRLGILDRVPFLADASPASVFSFAVPEYILYWGIVLFIAMLIEDLWARRSRSHVS